jgi:uncharacterized protein YegP (UPF0339 family)
LGCRAGEIDHRRPAMSSRPRFQLIEAAGETVRWRLLGGNNLSLGSGSVSYRTAQDCLAGIESLRADLDGLHTEFSHDNGARWRWMLYDGAELVAVASHFYGRRIEAQRGLDRFRAAVPEVAENSDHGRIVDWRAKQPKDHRKSS